MFRLIYLLLLGLIVFPVCAQNQIFMNGKFSFYDYTQKYHSDLENVTASMEITTNEDGIRNVKFFVSDSYIIVTLIISDNGKEYLNTDLFITAVSKLNLEPQIVNHLNNFRIIKAYYDIQNPYFLFKDVFGNFYELSAGNGILLYKENK